MFLVVWSVFRGKRLNTEPTIVDYWLTFETYAEAETFYEGLVKQDDLFTATIAQPVKSTDYDCVDVSD